MMANLWVYCLVKHFDQMMELYSVVLLVIVLEIMMVLRVVATLGVPLEYTDSEVL